MLDLLYKGGVVMIPLGLASLLALTVFLERLYVLRKSKVAPSRLLAQVEELLKRGAVSEALLICRQDPSPLARIAAAGLAARPDKRQEAMEDAGRVCHVLLKRFVGVLGTTAVIGPLLGLLGTVTGMISVFQDVTVYGVGNPADLAQGIWEALITTVAGLSLAIPCYIAYRFALSRVESLLMTLEEAGGHLLSLMEPGARE